MPLIAPYLNQGISHPVFIYVYYQLAHFRGTEIHGMNGQKDSAPTLCNPLVGWAPSSQAPQNGDYGSWDTLLAGCSMMVFKQLLSAFCIRPP